MTRRNLLGATALIGYYFATVFGHLEVSLWLVQQRESHLLGTYKLADFLPVVGALIVTGLVARQARRAINAHNRSGTLWAWAAWIVIAVLVDRLLIYSFPEYLHYPQYALLAWMLAWLTDPDRTRLVIGPVLLAVTALGIADEALQYTWITISYSKYLDFNDFVLNLVGGAAGVLLYYGFAPGLAQNQDPGSRITPRYERRFRDDQSGCHSQLDSESSTTMRRSPVDTFSTESRVKPGITVMKAPARYGLVGFAWLTTLMLIFIAALHTASTDPSLLQPIEREPSYNHWIPGPHAGSYYVLDPVTGTLLLAALGALASAMSIMQRRNK